MNFNSDLPEKSSFLPDGLLIAIYLPMNQKFGTNMNTSELTFCPYSHNV